MHTDSRIPLVNVSTSLKDAIIEMSAKGLGMTGIINEEGQLIGIFTDGDLRRWLNGDHNIFDMNITDVMTTEFTSSTPNLLAAETLKIMEDKKINGVFIIDEQNIPIGALNMHDLLKAGVL